MLAIISEMLPFYIYRVLCFYLAFSDVAIAAPLTNDSHYLPMNGATCSPFDSTLSAITTRDCEGAIDGMLKTIESRQQEHDQRWIFTKAGLPTTIGVPIRSDSGTCSLVIDLVQEVIADAWPEDVQVKWTEILEDCVKNLLVSYGGHTDLGMQFSVFFLGGRHAQNFRNGVRGISLDWLDSVFIGYRSKAEAS